MTAQKAVSTLKNRFYEAASAAGKAGRGRRGVHVMLDSDRMLTKKDLKEIVADKSYPQDLRAAADYLLDNPGLFKDLDGATAWGIRDGKIDMDDINKILDKMS